MVEPIVYLGGQFVPASQAKINIYDLGVVLGATLTEMTRTIGHKPFKLEQHVDRLYRSCKYTSIELPLDRAQMIDKSLELIEANSRLIDDDADLGVIHFVTPGENTVYAGSAVSAGPLTPTVCIHSFPLPFEVWRPLFVEGAHVVTPAIRHVPPQCVDPKTKNRSRLHFHLADQQSHAVDPKAISLLLDLDGNITECGGSNFVVIKGRTIYSPSSRNILQGVSLETVRELAPQLGLDFVEKDMQPYDVVNADEAWVTSTPYFAAPVTRINTIPIGTGAPGPVFSEMMQAWSDLVGRDMPGQIMGSQTGIEAAAPVGRV